MTIRDKFERVTSRTAVEAENEIPCPEAGDVKTTPHKTSFAVCLQGILVQNKFGTVTTSEFGTQSDKHNHMRNDLKHVETHEYINDS